VLHLSADQPVDQPDKAVLPPVAINVDTHLLSPKRFKLLNWHKHRGDRAIFNSLLLEQQRPAVLAQHLLLRLLEKAPALQLLTAQYLLQRPLPQSTNLLHLRLLDPGEEVGTEEARVLRL
jgi:hypothetical protein